MEDIRAQLYYLDMGLFRKHCIEHVTREEFSEINKPNGKMKAIKLTPTNWYGENLPEIIRT